MAKIDLTKIKQLAAEAAETGPDLNKQQSGGDFKPPAAGATRLRFVDYIEVGVHTTSSKQWGDKTKGRAHFGFELSGPKHPPRKLDDGRLVPERITFKLPIGQNKKNDYSKLFKLMAADHPGVKNFAQLLGEGFRGEVVHRAYKKRDGSDGVAAELKNEAGFTIKGLTYEDPESGEVRKVKVDEPISDIRLFLWDLADLDQWDSIFVDGTFDDGNTKNKFQEEIKLAENLAGSAIEQALTEAGREAELIPTPKKAGGQEADESDDGDDEGTAQEPVQEAQKQAQETTSQPAKGKGATQAEKPATARKSKPAPTKDAEPADDDGDPLQGL